MTTTPHGQVPEALEDFEVRKLAAIGAVRTSSGLVERRPIEYRRELEDQFVRGFRAAEKRLSALSAAPAGWRLVPVKPDISMQIAAKKADMDHSPLPDWLVSDWPEFLRIWNAMLAASPPAEQQAITPETGNSVSAQGAAITSEFGAVYAELCCDEVSRAVDVVVERCISLTQDATGIKVVYDPIILANALRTELRGFADRTHALRMEQAAPKAAPGEPSAFPMTGDEEESDLGQWQPGTAKPNMDGTYLREFDEGEATSEFHQGVWLRDGFFPSELQDVRWRGRAAPQQEAQEPAFWMNEKGHTWSHSDWKQFPKHRAKYPIPLYAHRPPPQPAPAPLMPRGDSAAPQLRAMATNYPPGHLWDKLDAKACIKGALEIEALRAPQPAPAPLSDEAVRDAAFAAVRKKLCALPRFSFLSDGYGAVRRVPDKSGSWIAFDAAHELFDPVAVDAALSAQGGE